MSQVENSGAALVPATRSGNADVLRLAVAQALAGANSAVVYTTGAIVGNSLAPSEALATLPISVFVVGMAACTLPAGASPGATAAAPRSWPERAVTCSPVCWPPSRWCWARSCCSAQAPSSAAPMGRCPLVPLRRRRLRPARPARESLVRRRGGRGVRRDHRPATRHLHHGAVGAIPVRGDVPGASGCGGPVRRRPARSSGPDAHGGGGGRRPPARRHPAPAPVHHRRDLRSRVLHAHELHHDGRAAGDAPLRPVAGIVQSGPAMAHRRDVCSELLHRPADRALRRPEWWPPAWP